MTSSDDQPQNKSLADLNEKNASYSNQPQKPYHSKSEMRRMEHMKESKAAAPTNEEYAQMVSKKPKAPREIHFKTYLKPERGVVYDMAKCHPDLWTKEQEWSFIEKARSSTVSSELETLRTERDALQKRCKEFEERDEKFLASDDCYYWTPEAAKEFASAKAEIERLKDSIELALARVTKTMAYWDESKKREQALTEALEELRDDKESEPHIRLWADHLISKHKAGG